LARDLLTRSLDIWGSLVVSLIHQFTPDRVIIGGGVTKNAEIILPHLQHSADRALIHWKPVDVVAAQLGDDAALIGMASFFEQAPEYI
jgi:glucokinase